MNEEAIQKILKTVRELDPILRYWIFKQYIEDFEDLEFLKTIIEHKMERDKK